MRKKIVALIRDWCVRARKLEADDDDIWYERAMTMRSCAEDLARSIGADDLIAEFNLDRI